MFHFSVSSLVLTLVAVSAMFTQPFDNVEVLIRWHYPPKDFFEHSKSSFDRYLRYDWSNLFSFEEQQFQKKIFWSSKRIRVFSYFKTCTSVVNVEMKSISKAMTVLFTRVESMQTNFLFSICTKRIRLFYLRHRHRRQLHQDPVSTHHSPTFIISIHVIIHMVNTNVLNCHLLFPVSNQTYHVKNRILEHELDRRDSSTTISIWFYFSFFNFIKQLRTPFFILFSQHIVSFSISLLIYHSADDCYFRFCTKIFYDYRLIHSYIFKQYRCDQHGMNSIYVNKIIRYSKILTKWRWSSYISISLVKNMINITSYYPT